MSSRGTSFGSAHLGVIDRTNLEAGGSSGDVNIASFSLIVEYPDKYVDFGVSG